MRKKLLYLLLVVLMLSLTACAEQEPIFVDPEDSLQTQESTHPPVVSYDQAIRLMMGTFSNDFTQQDLEQMLPKVVWTRFEENGKTPEQIYEAFSEKMRISWEEKKQLYGENVAVKYEYLDRTEYSGEEYEAFKAQMGKTYGISKDAFGICYEIRLKYAVVGSLKEEISTRIYHVVEIDGQWYITEALTDMVLLF